MKTLFRSLLLILALSMLFTSCGDGGDGQVTDAPKIESVDYASQLKLNMGSFTLKQEVTVKNFVDGDIVAIYTVIPE